MKKKTGNDSMENRLSRLRKNAAETNTFCDLVIVCQDFNAHAIDASLVPAFKRMRLAALDAFEALNGTENDA